METTTGNYVSFLETGLSANSRSGCLLAPANAEYQVDRDGETTSGPAFTRRMHLGPTRGCALRCAACGAHRGAGPAATPALAAEARNPRDAGQRWPATRYVRPSESGCRFSLAASVRMGTPARTRLRPSLRAPGCRSYMTRSMMFRQASQDGFSTRGDGGGHELSLLGSGGCDRCW